MIRFPTLPPSLPEFTQRLYWALTGSASGAAGRSLNRLLMANGRLACGPQNRDLMREMLRTDPNGVHTYTLARGWTAYGFSHGTMVLTRMTPNGAIAYPWVLHWSGGRVKPNIAAELMTITGLLDDHPAMREPLAQTRPEMDSKATPVWLSLPAEPYTLPSCLIKVAQESLYRFGTRGDLTLNVQSALLDARLDTGCTEIALATKTRDLLQWDAAFTRLLNHPELGVPFSHRAGQIPGKHSPSVSNWNMESVTLGTLVVKLGQPPVSSHDSLEAIALIEQFSIPRVLAPAKTS